MSSNFDIDFPFTTIVRNDPLSVWLANYLPLGTLLILALKWGSQSQRGGDLWEVSLSSAAGWTMMGGVVLAIAAGLLVWRVASVRRVLVEGERTEAKIDQGEFRQHGVRVRLVYKHLGQAYATETLLTKTSASSELRVGQNVELAIAPENPQRVYVLKVFQKEKRKGENA